MNTPTLPEVLCTLATNWVTCECAMRIANHGLDGWQKKIPKIDSEVDRIDAQLEVVESAAKKDELTAKRDSLKAQSQALFDEWKKADEETDVYRILFRDALRFFAWRCLGIGENDDTDFSDLIHLSLAGFDPERLPVELPKERCSELARIIRELPREGWESLPWATPVKPTMKAARRVAPNHRQSFIMQPDLVGLLLRTPQS